MDDNVNDEGWTYKEEEIIDLFNVFDDLPKTAEAHRAVAILLKHGAYNETALDHVNMAIKMSTDADNTFLVDATLLSIQINLAMKSWKNARDMVTKMLESNITMPPNLLRQYLVARAQAEAGAENLDLAIQSFAEAEKAGEEEPIPGELLREEFDTIIDKDEPSAAVDAVKRWKPVERLAWMTWNYYDDSEFHYNFQRAAGRCGQQDFMTKVYQEVIDLLDRIDASAPIKCQLATAKWKVCGDIEVAKSVFNEVLDKPSTGKQYALTNENPEDILLWATSSMSSLNYEQFRYARDPTVKMALYLETKDLVHKPLAQSISVSSSGLTYHSLILSRMARKMVGSQEFYRHLNDAFANCYAALTDKVGWNDCDVLLTLGVVLWRMEGLEEDARIALSCTFADLKADDSEDKKAGGVDGKVNGVSGNKSDEKAVSSRNDGKTDGEEKSEENGEEDEDEDGEEEDDEEEEEEEEEDEDEHNGTKDGEGGDKTSNIDEGDLADVEYLCDGECKPCTTWNNWKDTASLMHLCLTCDKVMLCDACHTKRLSYNNGADSSHVGISYCGEDHEYIVGPIEGWGGIKDGMMRIKGREDVKFKDWLDDLKERRWKEAWDRFWLSED